MDTQEVQEYGHKVAMPTTMSRQHLPTKFQGTILKKEGYLPTYLEMRMVILGTLAVADLTPDTLKELLDDPYIKHVTLAEATIYRR